MINSFLNNNVYKKKYKIFSLIKNLIDSNKVNCDTQLKIENFLLEYDISNLDKKSPSIYEFLGKVNKELKKILYDCREQLSDLINNFKKRKFDFGSNVKKLKQKDKIYYNLCIILNELSTDFVVASLLWEFIVIINNPRQKGNDSMSLFHEMGVHLIDSYYCILYEKEKKRLLKLDKNVKYNMYSWRSENKDILDKYKDIDLVNNMGAIAIDWLRDIDLVEYQSVKCLEENKRDINIVKISSRIEPLIGKLQVPLNLPSNLPMIVKPKRYYRECVKGNIYEHLGGYLLNGDKIYNEAIKNKWNLKYPTKINDINIVYDSINNINSVGYKINRDVLDFIRLYGIKFGLIMDDSYGHPLKEKLNNGNKLLKWEKRELEAFNSIKHLQDNILGLAEVFEDVNEFFIPVRMEFRGRINCIPEYLNYQSSELAKSLLMFSKGEKLSKLDKRSVNFLKAYGANCFGNKLDKKSWVDRVKWVEDNHEKIRNFYDGELLSKAESKLLFIAFCFEYNRWLACLENSQSTHFTTYLPIQLDATCNGYQHLSMLTLDHSLGNKVNLTESKEEEHPYDLYSFVSSFLTGYFDNKLKEKDIKHQDKASYTRLKNLKVDMRKLVKLPLMTDIYNATPLKIIDYLRESFEFDSDYTKLMNKTNDLSSLEIENTDTNLNKSDRKRFWYKYKQDETVKLEDSDFINLYKALKYILTNLFPSLVKIRNYFKEIASICGKVGITIPWKLPSGLELSQSYMQVKDVRLIALNYNKNTFSMKITIKDKYDKNKQIRALMPNVIHSLDAASLVMLIDNYFNSYYSKFKNIYSVHDCFAVTANNVYFILEKLKTIYIKIYSDKGFLYKFNNEIIRSIKVQCGNDSFDDEKLLIYLKDRKEPIKYPDISKVIKGDLDLQLIKNSSYILS